MSDTNTTPVPAKSPSIAEIVQRAAMGLDGIGINDELLREAVVLCEKEMDRIAASSLHSVLTAHIAQIVPPKQARKPRKIVPNDQRLTS